MPYSTLRLARRPSRSDKNTITLSSALLPRSRVPIHSARFPGVSKSRAGSELMAALRPSQGAGEGGAVRDADGEANHIRARGMLHHEHIARPHGLQKLGRRDLPFDRVEREILFEDVQHCIEQRR